MAYRRKEFGVSRKSERSLVQSTYRTDVTCDGHVTEIATLRWQRGRALTFRVSDGREEQVLGS